MPRKLRAAEISFLSTVAKAAVAGFYLRRRVSAEMNRKISETVRAMSATPKVAA
jgi:hypothetical protein